MWLAVCRVGDDVTTNAKLAIVVLNYRTSALTIACLASLEDQVDRTMRVLVVDNASNDSSADEIERAIVTHGWGAWVDLLRSPVNGGFAAGNNLAIRAIRADAYLLLNSDTLVRPKAIARLLQALVLRPEAGIVGPSLLNEHGQPDASYFRQPAPPSELLQSARTAALGRLMPRFEQALTKPNEPIEPDWIAFACAIIRREVIEQVGLLDDGYFMYFEDVDYCRRARALGWKVLFWPAAEVVHFSGGSSNVTSATARTARAPRYYYEARARYYAKFYGRRGLWLANGFWHLGRCISWSREKFGHTGATPRDRAATDIWTNALNPMGAAQ